MVFAGKQESTVSWVRFMAVAMDSLVLVLEELLFNATLRLTQGFKCAFNVILDTT